MAGSAWGDVDGPAAEEQSGYINGTPIGNEVPSTGVFTSLQANNAFTVVGIGAGYVKSDVNGLFSSAATVPVADIAGIVPVNKGGTGLDTISANALLYTPAIGVIAALDVGAEGQVLTVLGGIPDWQTLPGTGTVTSIDVSGGTTGLTFAGGPIVESGTITMSGILAAENGGTGLDTSAAANGQLLIGDGTGFTLATLTAGANITINNTAGGIEIVGTGGGGITGAFVENDQTVTADYTITAGRNAHSVGPITVASGVTVTVPSGSRWLVS